LTRLAGTAARPPPSTATTSTPKGDDSERAALIYLHSSRARQRALTDAVGEAARAQLAKVQAA